MKKRAGKIPNTGNEKNNENKKKNDKDNDDDNGGGGLLEPIFEDIKGWISRRR